MQRSWLSRLSVFVVLALCGLLLFTSSSTSRGTELRAEIASLPDLARERSAQGEKLEEEVSALQADVDRLVADTAQGDSTVFQNQETAERMGERTGLVDVAGPGLEIELTDGPSSALRNPDVSAADLLIHQQDLEAVVNAMWAGGASAVSVQDQRLIGTSSMRCVGNTLRINSQVFSPPYKIKAIGPVAELESALDESPQIKVYMQYVDRVGLGWSLSRHDAMIIPAYQGSLDIDYATVK